MGIIEAFGIDWRTMLIQLGNFLLLMAILYFVAYKPIINMLTARADKVAKGMRDADEAKERLEQAEKEAKRIRDQAERKAYRLISEAKEQAERYREEETNRVTGDLAEHRRRIHAQLDRKKATLVSEARHDVSNMVMRAVETVVPGKLSKVQLSEVTKDAINDLRT